MRYVFYAVAIACVVWLLIALSGATRSSSGDPIPTTQDPSVPGPPPATSIPPEPVNTLEVAALRRRVRLEHARYLAAHRRVRQLTRTLAHHTSTAEAISVACTVYDVSCSTLWRRANCESHLNPGAQNAGSGASGLFQFLGSTWASTPFGRFSVWSPVANALAAAWMIQAGRGGEWSCR